HVWGPRGREPNRLSILSRWKILDNLRRSTVEVVILAFILAGWSLLPGSPVRWTLLGLGVIAAPWVLSVLFAVLRPPLDRSWRAYYESVGRDAVRSAQQFALAVVFLPHQAWISIDAIVRTLWRVLVSRRNLLEWQTASVAEEATDRTLGTTWHAMRPVVFAVAALLVGTVVVAARRDADTGGLWHLVLALLPLTALWIASPAIAHALGAPALGHGTELGRRHRRQMLRYALLHWRYFDRFVTEETGWLAPDNVQEEPAPALAARTSPTNIGLQLLATVSAYDLGLVTLSDMTTRLEHAFASLARMQRFNGHFYNWYDLRTLEVLEPAYVSTVDSGNLAGHLVALRQACLALSDAAPTAGDGRMVRALDVALRLAAERLDDAASGDPPGEARRALRQAGEHVRSAAALLADALQDRSALAAVAEPLRRAHTAVLSAPLAPADATAAVEWIDWSLRRIAGELDAMSSTADAPGNRLHALANRAYEYAQEMDFRFLFDEEHKLFAIGYDQTAHARDASFYDLLASEARLASFIAIAKDDVPVEHWFRLGRALTHAQGATALVSWSGSMFEYLMPRLVMRSFPLTLLDHASVGAVQRQQAYGTAH